MRHPAHPRPFPAAFLTGLVTALGLLAAHAPARAQTADCDLGTGAVDFFVHLRFEDFIGCGGATGIPCSQGPHEEDLVGWGAVLSAGPGTTGDSGITDANGDVTWTGNGSRTNTCLAYGTHTVTFSVPVPNTYHPNATWPVDLSFDVTVNPVNASTGLPVERFFYNVSLGCGCSGDGVFCTLDTCLNGDCDYPPRPYDPARPEVCNDADDDCDGVIDEGLPATAPACNLASTIGCADKTREGFMDWAANPLIAMCGGAWSASPTDGLFADPSCNRAAGNHGANAAGTNCQAADLCPVGWHVCYGPDDVAQRLGATGCSGAVDPFYPNFGSAPIDSPDVSTPPGGAFFATRAQAGATSCSEGVNEPVSGGASALYGCGNMGATVPTAVCDGLNRQAGPLCGGLRSSELTSADDPATDYGYAASDEWAWSCPASGAGLQFEIVKTLPDRQGGVLCCKDADLSLAEVCDGVDNDLDGRTDESLQGGALVNAGQGCIEGTQCGTLACTPDGGWICEGLHACDDTTCNGIDEDEDGDTDDDYVAVATVCGTGACTRSGTANCVDGAVVDSCAVGAKAEASDLTCDGQDGDCDGDTDEDFAPVATSCGVGACARTGERSCTAGVASDSCLPGAPAASDAVCDGIDDDCDGTTDDGFVGQATSCGVGACLRTATEVCAGGEVSSGCVPGTPSEATDVTCDGQDGDCDGATDEEFVASATTCGVGACAGNVGQRTCASGAASDSCDPLAGATAETCDGVDENCDGFTDDGFGVGEACDGADDDVCAQGTTVCAADGTAACDETGPGEVEVCDGKDNDCDEEIDEGLAASGCTDRDEDTVPDQLDNCVDIANTDQSDKDGDGIGDVCDVLAQGGACGAGTTGGAGGTDLALVVALGLATLTLARRSRRGAGPGRDRVE